MAQRIGTYISYRFEDIVVQYFFCILHRLEKSQIKYVTKIECKKIVFVYSAGFDFESGEYKLLSAESLYEG